MLHSDINREHTIQNNETRLYTQTVSYVMHVYFVYACIHLFGVISQVISIVIITARWSRGMILALGAREREREREKERERERERERKRKKERERERKRERERARERERSEMTYLS